MRPGIVEKEHSNPREPQKLSDGTLDQSYVVGRWIFFKNAVYRGSPREFFNVGF
jgi:hypothetical protein